MKSILPIILIVLVLTGAIAYSLAKRSLPAKPAENIGISANKLESNITPTPAPRSPAPNEADRRSGAGEVGTTLPVVTEKTPAPRSSKSEVGTVTKTTICTPVYGSADTCTEHIVVDTGAENALFMNFAGLAYLGGLASFIKAKTLKK